ncbi:transporter substrate-binding domain-containing protein [Calidifontibacillus oryziterrae]|uniref:transporter substrate-binding domain-containing protein n=1 Tax=Calidifontibacillus oryziterrae TaxID=1191699 RepID=UPI0002E44D47|nr:transporter substrate-binding domain-containing protein [Calidifontibacillus oryziterrae]
MKKLISFGIMAIFLVSLLSACGQSDTDTAQQADQNGGQASGKNVLIMGTSADYPPFEYVDTAKSEEIIGFDVDLAKAVTEKLGYEIEIRDIEFAGLIEALKTGTVDFVLAGMSATDERRQSVDFSDTYYVATNMIVTKKDSGINTLEDLAGKKVGVQLGSIQAEKAEEISESIDITIDSRNRIPEIVQELKAGRYGAVIIEDMVAKGYLERNEDLTGFVINNDEETGFAVAFQKGSEEMVADFNRVINEMKESGELEQIINKWFREE